MAAIGIIHPPPDVRIIIDRTAQGIAKKGPELEKKLLALSSGDAKFAFLISSDPYHAYYQHRLLEFHVQLQSSSPAQQTTPSSHSPAPAPAADCKEEEAAKPDASAPAADCNEEEAARPDASAPAVDCKEEEAAKPDASALFKPSIREFLERIPAESDLSQFFVSPITGEVIPIEEMAEHKRICLIDPKHPFCKESMEISATIREANLPHDLEISSFIVWRAWNHPVLFGTTEEEICNAVKARIEKIKERQPKQVNGGSIGRSADQAMSQSLPNKDQSDSVNNEARNLPGPAAPLMVPQPPFPQGIPPPPSEEAPPPPPEEPEPEN